MDRKSLIEKDPFRKLAKIKALEVLISAGWTFEGALEVLEMTKEDYERWLNELKEKNFL
ncbi:MAG: hypothetical protein J7K58_05970 [Euryarchaeota archaeon]|nr:hypothetical protein [Euryarchaeota archaeon]